MSAFADDSLRALVVDDHPGNRRLICLTLSVAGLDAEAVATVAEAKDALSNWTPDIVLADLSLPDAHGTELVRWIRSRPDGAEMPVVAVSASARDEDVAGALEAGCDRFIAKPIDTRSFSDEVRETIALRRTRAVRA